jgi:hypothetical protein
LVETCDCDQPPLTLLPLPLLCSLLLHVSALSKLKTTETARPKRDKKKGASSDDQEARVIWTCSRWRARRLMRKESPALVLLPVRLPVRSLPRCPWPVSHTRFSAHGIRSPSSPAVCYRNPTSATTRPRLLNDAPDLDARRACARPRSTHRSHGCEPAHELGHHCSSCEHAPLAVAQAAQRQGPSHRSVPPSRHCAHCAG